MKTTLDNLKTEAGSTYARAAAAVHSGIGNKRTPTRLAHSIRRHVAVIVVVAAAVLAAAFAGAGIIGDGPRAKAGAGLHLAAGIIHDGPSRKGPAAQHLASGIIIDPRGGHGAA
jgi:hypothetical protein